MTQVQSGLLRGPRAVLNSYGGMGTVLREFGLVALLDAALREGWHRGGALIWRLLPGKRSGKYGLLEAILFPSYDYWLRYQRVKVAITANSPHALPDILEVGCGRSGIALFLKPSSARVCLVDRTVGNVLPRYSAATQYVRADACHLPFEDSSFPIVISVDTLEHIPREARLAFLRELKRVAKEMVILTCPLDSQDGRFQAGKFDAQLCEDLKKHNRRIPRWLEEHLACGHPRLEELMQEFEGARLDGWQHCESWERFQTLQLWPFLWIFGGIFYWAILQKHDTTSPFWRGILSWQKRETAEIVEQDEETLSSREGVYR